MQCKYCQKEVYVAHICPYCKEFYCMEHRDPKSHNCQVYQQMGLGVGIPTTPTQVKKPPAKEEVLESRLYSPKILNFQKNLFTCTFMLVLIEEILRLISYLRYSPYIEPNIYVALLSQFVTPYIASPIFFLTICTILFATKKLSERIKPKSEFSTLTAIAVPISVYVAIIIIYVYSIANWLLIIAP